MQYLGSFILGQFVRLGIIWTVAVGEPPITATSVSLRHQESGATLGPLAASVVDGEWVVTEEPTSKGVWIVDWETTPEGGVHQGYLYIS